MIWRDLARSDGGVLPFRRPRSERSAAAAGRRLQLARFRFISLECAYLPLLWWSGSQYTLSSLFGASSSLHSLPLNLLYSSYHHICPLPSEAAVTP